MNLVDANDILDYQPVQQSLYPQLVTDVQCLSMPQKQALHSLYRQFAQGNPPTTTHYQPIIEDAAQSLLNIGSEQGLVTACFGCYCGNCSHEVGEVGNDTANNQKTTEHLVEWETGSIYAWCIWDAFFIVKTVGQPAKISSIDPISHDRIEIYFDGVEFDSEPLWFSFPLGDSGLTSSIRACFCCRTKAFTSRDNALKFAKHNNCEVVSTTEMLERTEDMVMALHIA